MSATASRDETGKMLPFAQQNPEWRIEHTLYTVRGWCAVLHDRAFNELPRTLQDKMVKRFTGHLTPDEVDELLKRLL